MRKLVAILGGIGVGLVLTGAPAGAANRASDQKLAEAAILVKSEVPTTFTGGPQPDADQVTLPECKGAIATSTKLAKAAPHAQSVFALQTGTSGYARVESRAVILADVKKAKQVYAGYANDKTEKVCLGAQLKSFFGAAGTTVEISSISAYDPSLDSKGNSKVITGGDQFSGYGGGLRRTAGTSAPQFYEFEFVIARIGRAVGQFVFMNSGAIPPADATRWVQTVVTRLGPAK
jgi:hypothetical protein